MPGTEHAAQLSSGQSLSMHMHSEPQLFRLSTRDNDTRLRQP